MEVNKEKDNDLMSTTFGGGEEGEEAYSFYQNERKKMEELAKKKPLFPWQKPKGKLVGGKDGPNWGTEEN